MKAHNSVIARAALVVAAGAATAAAQQSTQQVARSEQMPERVTYSLAGTVADHDGNPVEGAEVALIEHDSATRLVRSDSAGRFEMASLPAALVVLRVRRLGYESRNVSVNITSEDHRSSVMISLAAAPAKLNGVSVVDIANEPDAHLREFYERKATNNFGHYVEQSAIESRRPQFLSEMLRHVPGVAVLASRRIGNTVKIRGCSPLVWVDGVRMPGAELDEVIQPAEAAAVEIYNSFAGIPAQYFDRSATCGTVLVWTRTR